MVSLLDLGRIMQHPFVARRKPTTISIDVTNKCNLRCKHCYFYEQEQQPELSEEELLTLLKKLKSQFPLVHASWIGGEPLLRKKVVEKGMRLFPFNMIVTNGTIELPYWKNCVFNVSVDGTRKYYEKVRGKHYDKVKQNADRDDVKVHAVCVLSRLNVGCIEEMVKEWSRTKVRGVGFDFYTPIVGLNDNNWISWKERDKIIDRLFALKKEYGDFLLNSSTMLKLMRSNTAKEIVANCNSKDIVYSIDPSGNRKLPCVIGEKADCTRCGCVVPYLNSDMSFLDRIKASRDARRIYSQF